VFQRTPGGAEDDTAAGVSAVLGFLGFSCPICNAFMLALFGSSALMTYLDPLRPLLGAVSVVLFGGLLYVRSERTCEQCVDGDATRSALDFSVPPTDLQDYSEQIRGIQGVIDVREMLTGRRNVHVDVVGTSSSDITRITDAIHDVGVEIESSEMMRQRHVQPFNHFFLQGTGETDARDNTSDE
jgi:hypothetical protein